MYLPDTNVWIQLLKGQNPALIQRIRRTDPDSVRLCSIVKAELFHGAHRYALKERRLTILNELFCRAPVPGLR